MTSATPSGRMDAEQLYQQLGALITFVRPLADRLMESGTLDGAVAQGKKMAAEAVMNQFQKGSTATGTTTGPKQNASAPSADMPTGGPSQYVGPMPSHGVSFAAVSGPAISAIGSRLAGGLAPGTMYVQAGLQATKMVGDFAMDYVETVQRETTARHDITARKDARIAEIETVRATLELYLEKTFDERRSNFREMFARLDTAQAQANLAEMQLLLGGILDLAKSSPFKDLATFKANLDNPDFVLEL
ncbi:hypothetical protein [Deinococcus arenicola]|nr:hypothetical protein [Deinococcus sp. ZS9-10]MDV6373669.1 hypothetical protein [Deinococcus sp. ZS9-10]